MGDQIGSKAQSVHQVLLQCLDYCADESNVAHCMRAIEDSLNDYFIDGNVNLYLFCRKRQAFFSSSGMYFDRSGLTESNPLLVWLEYSFSAFGCFSYSASEGRHKLTAVLASSLRAFKGLVWFIYERNFSHNLLVNLQRPIDYHQGRDSFLSDLKDLTAAASGMYAGAFREFTEDFKGLRTLFAWHPLFLGPYEAWDLEDIRTLPVLTKIVEAREPIVLNYLDRDGDQFFHRPEQVELASAVFCPCLVGGELVGVLSFAQTVPYGYSRVEIESFMALANSTSVALSNFKKTAAEHSLVGDSFANASRLTAVEVAQAARHTARAVLDTAHVRLAHLVVLNDKVSGEIRNKMNLVLQDLENDLMQVQKSLDDIKVATRPPNSEKNYTSFYSMFEASRKQLLGKTNKESIEILYRGADFQVWCSPDYIKSMLLNLFINSIDAFSLRKFSGKKNVILRYDGVVGEKFHEVTYIDNAGGLEIPKLKPWLDKFDLPLTQILFEKDVTTKGEEGSGWGLYLCRRVMRDHQGSIDLVDFRRGMTFRLRLPVRGEQ